MMENKKITIWDWIGAALLGAVLGLMFAYAISGGF